MAGEAGSLFVRIRPDTHGFKQEAESGIAGTGVTFKRLGELAGIAFGAEAVAGIVKEMVSGASAVQTATKSIVSEFGPAAAEVLKFGEQSAASLGISSQAADQTAVSFGILLGHLGFGQKAAADMTVNLEALAGQISQIKNIDPSTVLAKLPLVLAGNTRAIKALGFAFTPAQIQAEAFADGVGKAKGPLDASARAYAVYQLLLKQSGNVSAEAAKHQGDLSVQTRELSAQWTDAKDSLGRGLIPVLTQLVKGLKGDLPTAISTVKDAAHVATVAVKAFADVFRGLAGPLGGSKTAIEALVGAFAVKKVLDFVSGLGRARTEAAKQAAAANEASAAYDRLTAALEAFVVAGNQAVGTETRLAGGLNSVGTRGFSTGGTGRSSGARAGASSAAADTRAALGPVRSQIESLNQTARSGGARAGRSFSAAFGTGAQGATSSLGRVRSGLGGLARVAATTGQVAAKAYTAPFVAGGKVASSAVAGIGNSMKSLATGTASRVGSAFTGLFNGIKAGAVSMAEGVRAAFIEAVPILIITIAIQEIITHFGLIKKIAIEVVHAIIGSWQGAKDVLIGVAKTIGGAMAEYLTLPLRVFAIALGKLGGVLGFFHIHIADGLISSITGAIDSVTSAADNLTTSGAHQVAKGIGEIGDAASKAFTDSGKKVTKAADPKKSDSVPGAVNNSAAALKAANAGLRQQLAGLGQASHDGTTSAANQLAQDGQQLKDAITQQAQDVKDAVEGAKSNLNSLAGTLTQQVGQILDAPIQAAQERLQRLQNLQTLNDLRSSLLLPGGKQLSADPTKALAQLKNLAATASAATKNAIQDYITQYQGAALAVKQDQVNVTKEATTRRIGDLANDFNRGKISFKTFTKDVAAILRQDKLPFKAAGQILGSAFLDGFHTTLQGLFTQGGLINRGPRVAGTTGQNVQLTDPLKTLHEDQRKIADIQKQIGNDQLGVQKEIRTASKQTATHAAKTAKILAQIAANNQEIARREKRAAQQNSTKNAGHATVRGATFAGTVK